MAWSTSSDDAAENPMLTLNRGGLLGGLEEFAPMPFCNLHSLASYLSHQNGLRSESHVADRICTRRPVEKKKRLTPEQINSLEMSFEMENKLAPERKRKLANDLGLQPRQVAIWFQNRRARWKTRRLEKEYDSLRSQYDAMLLEREALRAEVNRLTKTLEAREKNGDEVKKQHVVGIVHEQGYLHLREDKTASKKTLQVLDKDFTRFQSDSFNEKETLLHLDQTDIFNTFHCDIALLQDHTSIISSDVNLIKMENIPDSYLDANDYAFEQMGCKTEDYVFSKDQHQIGHDTMTSYDVSWLWLN